MVRRYKVTRIFFFIPTVSSLPPFFNKKEKKRNKEKGKQ